MTPPVLPEALAAAGEPQQGLATLNKALALVEGTVASIGWSIDRIKKSRLLLAGSDEAGAAPPDLVEARKLIQEL